MRSATETARLQAEHLLDVERFDDARRVLGTALAQAPDDPELLWLAATVEGATGRWPEAERLARAVLARSPGHRGARSTLFQCACAGKRYAEAEREILDLLREDPEDAFLLTWYARLMLSTLHVEKARALVSEALRLAPDLPQARLVDALLSVVEGRGEAAQARVAELMREVPDGEAVARTLLVVLAANRRHRDALEVARALLRVRPNDPGLLEALVELRAVTHWTSLPLWPVVRFGWGFSIALWVLAVFGIRALRPHAPALSGWLSLGILAYVVYSWVHLPLLRRWLRWRGF